MEGMAAANATRSLTAAKSPQYDHYGVRVRRGATNEGKIEPAEDSRGTVSMLAFAFSPFSLVPGEFSGSARSGQGRAYFSAAELYP
jgi:hypothetical protein